jgi:CPA2 family monovalent cation:H+ antiporter-2
MRTRTQLLTAAMLPFLSVAAAAGETPPYVAELALLLVVSAAVAFLFFRLGITPIVGFLAAGVLIGPSALGLVRDAALIDAAAEIGVILLLFTIGIEFSLDRLARIRRLVLVGGGAQVGVTTLATWLILIAFGIDARSALYTGFLVALSSTAIVMKLLSDRAETNTPSGQAGLGVLIFQDLAVVLMVLLVPILGGEGGGALEISWALVRAVGIVLAVLLLAGRVMPKLLEAVARTCSQEIFLLTIIGICFGTAFLTSLAGVSLSLGAFLAGLLVSESRFGQQALSEILPLQILFSAAFFLSVGLLLDLSFLISNLPLVLGALLVVVVFKTGITTLGVRLLGRPLSVALPAGLLLAQLGEFSFVLERSGREVGLSPLGLGEVGTQTFIACTVLLMAATPWLAQLGHRIGRRLEARGSVATDADMAAHGGEAFDDLEDHVVIAGYGGGARRLAAVLDDAKLPYGIVTLSPAGASEAQALGRRVLLGDYARQGFLQQAGIERARIVVVPDDEPAMAHRVTSVIKANREDVPVVVGTRFDSNIGELNEGGADIVVSQERAAAEDLVGAVLKSFEFDHLQIATHLEALDRETVAAPAATVGLSEQQLHSERCSHTAVASVVARPEEHVCPECVALGDSWVHLRVCLTCGYTGCCDDSKNRHARHHFKAEGHPIIRSLEPGESWAWCYVDETTL